MTENRPRHERMPLADQPGADRRVPSSHADDSLIGRLIDDRYRVVEHIADGGMGSVYRAEDERLGRDVALKVMHPELARDRSFVERFRREARSAARLVHPNVVAVYDQGEDDGLVFLVMEYVPGATLREWLARDGALTPRETLDVAASIASALSAAHRIGVIHRDIKPENVLIAEDGTAKVADFGLARATAGHTETAHTGSLLGTVAYLAPEQVERGIADARSDVYAAGLVIVEMLTGARAVQGESPIHVAYQQVHGTIPLPSERVADLDPALDDLVDLATRNDPDERLTDGADLLGHIRQTRDRIPASDLDARPLITSGTVDPEATGVVRTHTAPVPRLEGTDGRVGSGSSSTDDARGRAGAAGSTPPTSRTTGATSSDGPPRTRRRGVRAGILGLFAALLLGGGGFGWWAFLGPGSARTVPDVAGRPENDAVAQVQAQDLSAGEVQAYSETVPPGTVISTDPIASAQIRRGQTVTITVSRGPERHAVPAVVDRSQAEATAALTAATLAVGTVSTEYSETVPNGTVISSSPAAGQELKPGAAVALVVSKGRRPITVTDMRGRRLSTAQAAWEEAGLTVVVTGSDFSTTVPKGAVLTQNPASGTLHRGDTITVTQSKGPDLVTVPSVAGRREATARAILESAGFTVRVTRYLGGILGVAQSTDPGSGTQAPRGSTITLRIV